MKIYKMSFRNDLDILAQNIARRLFKQIILDPSSRQITINSIRSSTKREDIDLSLCGLNKVVFDVINPTKENNDDNISVNGLFLPDTNVLLIRVEIRPIAFSDRQRESLLQQLKYTLRHEINHAFDHMKDPDSKPAYVIPQQLSDLMEGINLSKSYHIDLSEVDAYMRDLMLKAKNLKVPVENLVKELIKNKLFETNPTKIDFMIKTDVEFGKMINNYISEIQAIYFSRIKEIYNRKSAV